LPNFKTLNLIFYELKDFDLNKVLYFCRVIKFKIKELCQTLHQE